jgi:hypothetical protein
VLAEAGWHEARWLMRSPLFLAGLVVSAWLIWLNARIIVYPGVAGVETPASLFWWTADVSVVAGLLPAAGAALLAAQLAAGRSRRDAMEQLYASYPASPATRAGAQLLGAAGPLIATVVLIAAAVAWIDSRSALGQPRWWVLAAGLLLVALGSTAGTALGRWQRHPMAGILLVLVLGLAEVDLSLTIANPIHLAGGTEWLFPWAVPGGVLNALPGLIVPYPPPAHLAELAGLIGLAVVAALWRLAATRRAAAGIAVVAVAALAVTVWSGVVQHQGVSRATEVAMAAEISKPGSVQQCQLTRAVRYCYYPAFAPLARQWAVPVSGVLARIPAADRSGLTVRQVWDSNYYLEPLVPPGGLTSNGGGSTAGLPPLLDPEALATDPAVIPGSGPRPVYTDADWGAGASLAYAQLGLAVSTAEWATGLPTTGPSVTYHHDDPGGGFDSGTDQLACVPAGQARGAIAVWLAAGSTPGARSALPSAAGTSVTSTRVGQQWIATVQLYGSGPTQFIGLNATVQQVKLARAMLALPAAQVQRVLGSQWQSWLAPSATTAQLAAALGIPLPAQPNGKPPQDGGYTPPTQVCR